MSQAVKSYEVLGLPAGVVTKVELSRLVTEFERIDIEKTAVEVRIKAGATDQATPALSDVLNDFLNLNEISLDDSQGRSEMIKQMRLLKDKAPVIHMTFSVPADGESLQHLAHWVRSEVHPQAVIEVGLQPALVAGVYLRTPNHVHDLSVRGILAARHGALVEELGALSGTK